MAFFRTALYQRADEIRETKATFDAAPFSPVKKTIMFAVFDYYINICENRGILELAFTNATERLKNLNDIIGLLNQKLSDEAFLESIRNYINTNLNDATSSFRRGLAAAYREAATKLGERRTKFQYGLNAVMVLTAYCCPIIGIPALILTLSTPNVGNELLEIYDSTKLGFAKNAEGKETPCPEIYHTYHRL